MSKRCYLFVSLNGRVSFWEYSEEAPALRSIQKEFSLPLRGFWDRWKENDRLEDDEVRDFLFLSDRKVTRNELPPWFFEHATETSYWTGDILGTVFAGWEPCAHRTIAIQVNERRSTIWHGGDPTTPLILYGISTSRLGLSSDEAEGQNISRLAMKAFLSGSEERHVQNERRCASRR